MISLKNKHSLPLKEPKMSSEDFIEFLKNWISRVNKFNQDNPENTIILDEDYFSCNERGYKIKEDAINVWDNPALLFIGDNPGKREKENKHYFHFDAKCKNQSECRTAGYKFHKLLEKLGVDEKKTIKFNKCLISTGSTKDLKIEQISACSVLVCDFICSFHARYPGAFIIFSGIAGIKSKNSKFKEVYGQLNDLLKQKCSGFMGHISRRKFSKAACQTSIKNLDDLKSFSCYYKEMLFSDENINRLFDWCKECPIRLRCKGRGDDGDLGLNPISRR